MDREQIIKTDTIFRTDKVVKEKVDKYFKKIISGEINPLMLHGAFGDIDNCSGIVEEQVFPEEGGAYLKLLGCNYLLKGCPMGMIYTPVLESLSLAKMVIIQSIKAISKSWFLKITLLSLWLFNRRKFYYFLNTYIHHIHGHTVGVGYFKEKRYNKFATEIRRAFRVALEKELKTEKPLGLYRPEEAIKNNKLRILVPLMKFMEVTVFCVDWDTAYRFQSQDAFSNLNKNNDAVKESERLIKLMSSRYTDYVRGKVEMLGKFIPLLRFSPLLKRILTNFFQELDIEKVKLDEADWYYSLRRERYNFGGLTLEERLEQVKRIDKEQGHARIKFKYATEKEFKEIVKKQKR